MDKRVKVIISIVVIVALILASYILIPLLKKNSGDSTVKISGKIIFDQYENGHIFIGLHSTDPLQIDSPPDIAKLEISRPGPYEIKVPKKTGRVYIAAVNSEEELREKPSFEVPRGLHVNNPIVIDASDIDGIDITLVKDISSLMEDYKDSTVSISGNITFKDYKEGSIFVYVHSRRPSSANILADIARVKISNPGPYEVKVPQNIGKVYVTVINFSADDIKELPPSTAPIGWHAAGSIDVSSKDIKDVDIELNILSLSDLDSSKLLTAMTTYIGPTVTISGNVQFEGYKGGAIFVEAHSKDPYETEVPPDIAITKILKPGPYKMKVPKNIGQLYVAAMNLPTEEIKNAPSSDTPIGWYVKNPIKVGSRNIKDIDMELTAAFITPPEISTRMDNYTGPTVTISGDIAFKDYKDGDIIIEAYSEDPSTGNIPPDISMAKISKPGPYEIKVPKKIGKLYITAMNPISEQMLAEPPSDMPIGWYVKNPIKVGSRNIKDIDMELTTTFIAPSGLSTKMDNYTGPTVIISGNIAFKDYKDGDIIIEAYSEDPSTGNIPPDIAMVKIPKPGTYNMEVPVKIGQLYVAAMNIPANIDALESPPIIDIPMQWYLKNPIKVGSRNIKDIDMELTTTFIAPSGLSTKMENYTGPTVIISGNIAFKDYKDGDIIIEVYSEDPTTGNIPPDIAVVKISKPGPYEIKVPKKIGKLYITAMNPSSEQTPVEVSVDLPIGWYVKNPIKVGSRNIKDIDLELAVSDSLE